MKKFPALVVSLFACVAAYAAGPLDAVDRAISAIGGASSLGGIKTFSGQGTAKHWDPEQSFQAGGEKRFAGDSSFTDTRDFAAKAARIDWQRKLVYPDTVLSGSHLYGYSEIFVAGGGFVNGIDSFARTKRSRDANPPGHRMSKLRTAIAERELVRTSPRLLADMRANAGKLAAMPDTRVGADKLTSVKYNSAAGDLIVMFDRKTGLPARIRTLDYDFVQGDSNFDLVLGDWREAGGVKFPHRQAYQLNGTDVSEFLYRSVQFNAPFPGNFYEVSAALRAAVPSGAPKVLPAHYFQWMTRRQYYGGLLDDDRVAYDPATSPGWRLIEISPRIQHVRGSSANSMIVEMQDYLIVVDSPLSDEQSRWTIEAAHKRYPGKPIRYLALTHHHNDHVGGLRSYVSEGAILVVGPGTSAHYRKILSAAHTRNPYLPQAIKTTRIQEVTDHVVITDGSNSFGLYVVDNTHVAGMLMGYLPDARLAYVTDIWAPGFDLRQPLTDKLSPTQAAIVNTVRKFALQPERFIGGHGVDANYSDLTRLYGK